MNHSKFTRRRRLYGVIIGVIAAIGIALTGLPGIGHMLDERRKRQTAQDQAKYGVRPVTAGSMLRAAARSFKRAVVRLRRQTPREQIATGDDEAIRRMTQAKGAYTPVDLNVANLSDKDRDQLLGLTAITHGDDEVLHGLATGRPSSLERR